MKKLEMIKTGVSLVISIGVGIIVKNVIKATTPKDIKKITKFCVLVGGIALSDVLGQMATKYVEDEIDDTVDKVKNIIKEETSEKESKDN